MIGQQLSVGAALGGKARSLKYRENILSKQPYMVVLPVSGKTLCGGLDARIFPCVLQVGERLHL